MKTFVIGDIHGAFKALKICLEKSNFDYDLDTLICLGDIGDRSPDVVECIDEVLKIKNLIYIRGNHDRWLMDWFFGENASLMWLAQGGQVTMNAYVRNEDKLSEHWEFFQRSKLYFIDDENRIFVHGGFDPKIPIEENDEDYLLWDRTFIKRKNSHNIEGYKEVFVGHSNIWCISEVPMRYTNIWFMDTGAGGGGRLSIMDVDTKEVWQSDRVKALYPVVTVR